LVRVRNPEDQAHRVHVQGELSGQLDRGDRRREVRGLRKVRVRVRVGVGARVRVRVLE
jgi:hypothetical protein